MSCELFVRTADFPPLRPSVFGPPTGLGRSCGQSLPPSQTLYLPQSWLSHGHQKLWENKGDMVQQPGFTRAGGEAAAFGISAKPQDPGEKAEETLMEARTCFNPLGICSLRLTPW